MLNHTGQLAVTALGNELSTMKQRRALLISVLAMLTTLTANRSRSAALQTRPTTGALQIGVATHYGMYGESLNTLGWVSNMGLDSIRDEAYWSHVESSSGVLALPPHVARWYAAVVHAGIVPLLLLSYGHPSYEAGARPATAQAIAGFARYAAFVARHLPAVRQFQVWNEWELTDRSGEPGGAREYLRLLQSVSPVLRAVRPGALVLPAGVQRAGCFNGYLEFLVRGGLLQWADGIALHTYRFEQPDPSPEAWYRELLQLAVLIGRWDPKRGPSAHLYVTEMGFPSHTGRHGLSVQAQADYLERCILLGATLPGLRGFWWYGLRDKGITATESEHHYGLLEPDGTPKPSSVRLQALLMRLRGASRVTLTCQQAGCWAVQLVSADNSVWLAQWSPAADKFSPFTRPPDELGPQPRWSRLKAPEVSTAT